MKTRLFFNKPVNSAVALLSGVIRHDDALSDTARAAVLLMGTVLWADGKLEEQEIESFREILSENYSGKQVERCVNALMEGKSTDVEQCCNTLLALDIENRRKIVLALLELSFSNDDFCQAQRDLVALIADKLQIDVIEFEQCIKQVKQQHDRKNKIVRSGTGIIVAIVVVVIFILAATFLKAVVFGLILACLCLPLEKFYERKFASSAVFLKLFYLAGMIISPFKKISECFKHDSVKVSAEEQQAKRQAALINKATTATVATFVSCALILLLLLTVFSFNYASGMSGSIKKWMAENMSQPSSVEQPAEGVVVKSVEASETEPVTAVDQKTETETPQPPVTDQQLPSGSPIEEKAAKTFFSEWLAKLEQLKPKVEKIAIVKWGIEQVSQYLNNPDNQKALIAMVMKKTSGVFSFTAGFVANIFSFMLEILLTIFFFSLILNKMASFSTNGASNQAGYMIEAIFGSNWMPVTSEATLNEAKRIITAIILKLKIWLKGYASIIAIETTVYIIGFFLIGVPHAVLLGMIAGCTVLLPYIGPLSSGILTSLVCLAVGGDDVMVTIVLTIIFYMIMNGIVEQLFLYPTLVGEALGLTTLETIIVVLLGGVFAGFFGMIFAVPAASVLKYLIPQIYRCWQRE